MLISEALSRGKNLLKLSQHCESNYSLEGDLLMVKALNLSNRESLLSIKTSKLGTKEKDIFFNLLERRLKGEPIAYILQYKDFWNTELFVTPAVLIPRPETEILIELALKYKSDKKRAIKILDIGTGSGCLIINLLQEYSNAVGIAIDISASAISIARKNSIIHNVYDRINLIESNLFDSLPIQVFDIIVSNPPYIAEDELPDLPTSVKDYEPHTALFAKNNGLEIYQKIGGNLKNFLSAEGIAIFEFGKGQKDSIAQIFDTYGFTNLYFHKDLAQNFRAVVIMK